MMRISRVAVVRLFNGGRQRLRILPREHMTVSILPNEGCCVRRSLRPRQPHVPPVLLLLLLLRVHNKLSPGITAAGRRHVAVLLLLIVRGRLCLVVARNLRCLDRAVAHLLLLWVLACSVHRCLVLSRARDALWIRFCQGSMRLRDIAGGRGNHDAVDEMREPYQLANRIASVRL